MRLEVLRSAALCWFGNEHLASEDEARLTEVSLKSCFRGVERLEFVRPNAHHLAAPGAAFVLGTKTWFRRLKADGVESLRLHLPLSLMEPLPAAYGVVTDSPLGSDIWVTAGRATARSVEYSAQRFAAWSVPRPRPAADIVSDLMEAVSGLDAEAAGTGSPLSNRISRLSVALKLPGGPAEGFEDCIPPDFPQTMRFMAARAVRTVAILGIDDPGMETSSPFNEHVDGVWKLALRLIEAIAAEAAEEQRRMVA